MDTVQGFVTEFISCPFQEKEQREIKMSLEQEAIVDKEIVSLIVKKYDRRSGGIGKVFCKQFVFGGKEGQRVASSDKSQRAKQVLNVSSFQNGGNPLPKGFIDGEGLDGKVGSQGCILYNSHGKGESKMLAI